MSDFVVYKEGQELKAFEVNKDAGAADIYNAVATKTGLPKIGQPGGPLSEWCVIHSLLFRGRAFPSISWLSFDNVADAAEAIREAKREVNLPPCSLQL